MANLKNITELPVAESVEGLNLIVNDNGAAKQIPISAVDGKVKTVNSISPDINGNVQIDTASSWNDLKDKPFGMGTETLTILENYTDFQNFGDIWSAEFVIDGPSFAVGDTFIVTAYGKQLKSYMATVDGNPWLKAYDDDGLALTVETWEEDGKSGFYIELHRGITALSISVIRETVHKLDAKYLPNELFRMVSLSDVINFGVSCFSDGGSGVSEREITQEEWSALVAFAVAVGDDKIAVWYDGYGVNMTPTNNKVYMHTTRYNNNVQNDTVVIDVYSTELTYDEVTKLVTATYYCASKTLS